MLGGSLVSFARFLRELGANGGQFGLLEVEAAIDEGLSFSKCAQQARPALDGHGARNTLSQISLSQATMLRGDYRETLRFERQAVTAAQQKEMFDWAEGDLRALGLTDPYKATFEGFFLTQLVDLRIRFAHHRQSCKMKDVGLPGRGIDEHRN